MVIGLEVYAQKWQKTCMDLLARRGAMHKNSLERARTYCADCSLSAMSAIAAS